MIKIRLLVLSLVATFTMSAGNRPMTLDELFELTDMCSRQMTVARTDIEAARQGVAAARSKRLPDINAQLSVSYLGNILMTDRKFGDATWEHTPHLGNSFSLEVRQMVYAGGAITAGIKLAELRQQNAEALAEATRQQQRFIVLGQYLDIFKLNNRMVVYERNIELTRQLIDNIKEKQARGMALRNDVTRYELQLQNLQLDLITLQNRRDVLNHRLCNTLSLPDTVTIVPAVDLSGELPDVPAEGSWQQLAAATSPVLRQGAVASRIAAQQEKVARSEMLPKISVFAADNLNGPVTFEIPPLDKNINAWHIGVGVSYNLGNLYKSSDKLKQTRLATRRSREALAVSEQDINNAMQAAHSDYRQSLSELETRRKGVQLAGQNYEVINERYLNQLALVTDMVDASNLKLNAELPEVDARINIVFSYYKMRYIAGTL